MKNKLGIIEEDSQKTRYLPQSPQSKEKHMKEVINDIETETVRKTASFENDEESISIDREHKDPASKAIKGYGDFITEQSKKDQSQINSNNLDDVIEPVQIPVKSSFPNCKLNLII